MTESIDDFTLAKGFEAAAVACGLKKDGALDLALVFSPAPCAAAGVFTTNRIKAAPVLHDQRVLAHNAGNIRAVVANSGCANACTGPGGLAAAARVAELAAAAVGCAPEQVLVLSTGVIGRPLDVARVAEGLSRIRSSSAQAGASAAARAILTTDTRPKTVAVEVWIGGAPITFRGFAKGAGMIHPGLATMLAVVTTDARVAPHRLKAALSEAAGRSFNRLSVDGDMSTNDTVLLLASGSSGNAIADEHGTAFVSALTEACVSLTRQIARDGEGATRLVEITVCAARDECEAHRVADSIARSPLVKTAIHGGDPNWGRILAAAGTSDAPIDPDCLTLSLGPLSDPLVLVSGGLPVGYHERAASDRLKLDPVVIRLDLGLGAAEATVWTCDLSAEYVAINAHYTT